MSWSIVYTKQAQRDARKIASSNLQPHAQRLLDIMGKNPFQTPSPVRNSSEIWRLLVPRRTSIQHRLVYQVYEAEQTIKILRMWTTTSEPNGS
ncbi:MAG: type II toxin-antitoxin system RelE/ParE family toxin [Chthoniobacterales bacterium]|nr:type II toxin-antitoxin system RelE/ParE family toxin [Chthoniobacterales bacterium]